MTTMPTWHPLPPRCFTEKHAYAHLCAPLLLTSWTFVSRVAGPCHMELSGVARVE
jgi:hypothetical protein